MSWYSKVLSATTDYLKQAIVVSRSAECQHQVEPYLLPSSTSRTPLQVHLALPSLRSRLFTCCRASVEAEGPGWRIRTWSMSESLQTRRNLQCNTTYATGAVRTKAEEATSTPFLAYATSLDPQAEPWRPKAEDRRPSEPRLCICANRGS